METKIILYNENPCIKVKVIMLPTNDGPKKGSILLRHLWIGIPKLECRSLWQYEDTIAVANVTQYTTLNGSFRDCAENMLPQYLYITTDEKIVKGDWFINTFIDNEIWQHNGEVTPGKGCLKIIATSDTELGYGDEFGGWYPLPQPSQEFIEKYCKVGGIDEVLVEYEEYVLNSFGMSNGEPDTDIRLKVDSHNTITIHPIKDSWNSQEVLELCKDYYDTLSSNLDVTSCPVEKESKIINNWVKENLN